MAKTGDKRQTHAIILTMSEPWPGMSSLPLRKRDGGRGTEESLPLDLYQ